MVREYFNVIILSLGILILLQLRWPVVNGSSMSSVLGKIASLFTFVMSVIRLFL